jgi:hypothetical protein
MLLWLLLGLVWLQQNFHRACHKHLPLLMFLLLLVPFCGEGACSAASLLWCRSCKQCCCLCGCCTGPDCCCVALQAEVPNFAQVVAAVLPPVVLHVLQAAVAQLRKKSYKLYIRRHSSTLLLQQQLHQQSPAEEYSALACIIIISSTCNPAAGHCCSSHNAAPATALLC